MTIALLAAAATPALADVPAVRNGGPTIVVCRPDSAARIRAVWPGRGPAAIRSRAARLRLLGQCGHADVQAAVAAASAGTRVLVLPGVYRGPAITIDAR